VYCGAGGKMSKEFKKIAHTLGFELAKNGFGLVTGGANVGMMKEVVDGHIEFDLNATRHGVLPSIFREFEIQHTGILPENMRWPEDVHSRLKTFYDLADDIVVLPGGFGTLHELMDCLVHIQFDLIQKRVFLLNFNHFWDGILQQFRVMVEQQAVQQKHVDNLVVVDSVADLIQKLNANIKVRLAQGVEASRWESED
jgi:uncharacterized protein (TIGR00730 family)